MPHFQNASIGIKSLIAPLVSAVAIVAIAILLAFAYSSIASSTAEKNAANRLVEQVRAAQLDLTAGHAALYRAVSLKSQGVENAIVRVAKNEALDGAHRGASNLKTLDAASAGLDAQVSKEAATAADTYEGAAKAAADIVEADAFSATMFMTDAEQKFAATSKLVTALSSTVATQRDTLETRAAATLRGAAVQIGIAALLAIVLSLGAAVVFGRMISVPIKAMTATMGRLAAGDLAVELPATDRGDEVGAMAKAVQVFRDNAVAARDLAQQQAAEQAAKATRAQRLEELVHRFEAEIGTVVERLSSASSGMKSAAAVMTETAAEANQRSTTVAAASEEAFANVQTVASAAEELASSVREISRQVQQSTDIARRAVEKADSTSAIVSALSQGVQKIGEVTDLINNIAAQTNLLALNATIEAARAGEAGRGFAVVASEVKGLATQTAKATEDITEQISAIQTSTRSAVTAIEEIGAVIKEISGIASGIAAAVEEQGAATNEIARNVQQAAMGTHQVSENISGVSATVGRSSKVAEQVKGAAEEVAAQSDGLRGEVGAFVAKVKAA
ncbi:MAG TPA: HAMP domain-containing methyl-accepting chemotaxis protein [Stellaceae bacterium]|nr:HAMP domain-containing methyl-accepting chemotaxis protein [Stellaceae bacterium]